MLRIARLGGGERDLFVDEIASLLRHPYATSAYLVFLLVSLATTLFHSGPAGALPGINLRLPLVALGAIAGGLLALGGLWVLLHLTRHRQVVRLHLSLPMALSVLAAQAATALMLQTVFGIVTPSAPIWVMILTVLYATCEGLAALILGTMANRILADIRRGPVSGAPPPLTPVLRAGTTTLPAPSVLRLQAQGNYVALWTETSVLTVPGPFGTLLAQMPDDLGCLVHRSEWVATRAVASAHRQGRSAVLVLTTGDSVRVAASRTASVRDWMARFLAPPRRKRPYSTGGGDTKRQSRPASEPTPDTTTSAIGGTTPSAPKASVIPTNS